MPPAIPLEERFWAKVDVRGLGECWEWRAGRFHDGYGYIRGDRHGPSLRAHRVSWELHYGRVPNGLFVCHHCDNPPCVNPRHLFLGTPLENTRDAAVKGLLPTGEKNAAARLTERQAVEIRSLHRAGANQYQLAELFGVSQSTISRTVNGRHWRGAA